MRVILHSCGVAFACRYCYGTHEGDMCTVSVTLVLFGGLMSGLTLGLMSLDTVQLEVLKRTGTPVEKEQATRIMPVRLATHSSYLVPHPLPHTSSSRCFYLDALGCIGSRARSASIRHHKCSTAKPVAALPPLLESM